LKTFCSTGSQSTSSAISGKTLAGQSQQQHAATTGGLGLCPRLCGVQASWHKISTLELQISIFCSRV